MCGENSWKVSRVLWWFLLQLKETELKSTAMQETVLALETELGDVRAAFREQEVQLETQKHKELELLSTVRR